MKTALVVVVALVLSACEKSEPAPSPQPAESRAAAPAPPPATPPAIAPASIAASTRGRACSPGCLSIERCEDGRCVPNCPAGEVYVPATGPEGFRMGRGGYATMEAAHNVVLTRPFCMDATEVTVAAYRRCVDASACTIPQLMDANSNYRSEFHRDDHPVNMVNWGQARSYCESRGQKLPTEAQWEWAAGHGDGRKYPWGNEPEPSCENQTADFTPGGSPKTDPAGDVGCHGGGTSKVKAHPAGKTSWPSGDIYDLGGNLWEWTSDCYTRHPSGSVVDPRIDEHPNLRGVECYMRVLRGGAWNRSREALNPSWRGAAKRTYRVPGLGFRCVRNP